MSQADYNLANQSGANFRTELNAIVAAVLSNNASALVPSTTVAYMWYTDSSAVTMKVRNAGDTLFMEVFKFNASTITPYANGELLSSPVQTTKNNRFSKAQRGQKVSVSYASTVTLDLNLGNDYHLNSLTGNLAIANPSAIVAAASALGTQSGSIWIPQDGTGSRTVSFGTMFKFVAGTAPTASTASGTTDRCDYKVRNASTIDAAYNLNVS